MDNSEYKSLVEAAINYTIETNKQVYEFGSKMVKDYAEFSKSSLKLMPGMEAWAQWVPVTTNKK